ncbi:MAG: hypothetical protein Q9169_002090 [Polycauliona sp. 2 TL-2023]
MRLTVLALALHATPRLAQPISAGLPVRQLPTTEDRLSKANVQSPSVSTSPSTFLLSDSFDVTSSGAHTFTTKGTNVVLTITVGAELDGPSLTNFLDATHDVMVQSISKFGGASVLPLNILEWDQGQDLQIITKSAQDPSQALTWALTTEVIEGLQRLLGGIHGYHEVSCRVNLATEGKDFLGYVDVRRKKEIRQANLIRSLPIPPSVDDKNISTTPFPVLRLDPNVHIDIHPSFFSRLDIRAVLNILAITKDWAQEHIERVGPHRPIDHGEVWKTLAEGVQIKMSAAPQKRLTYGLVSETIDQLLLWEWDQHEKKGTAKAVEFGILQYGVFKGAGSIKKDRRYRLDVAR